MASGQVLVAVTVAERPTVAAAGGAAERLSPVQAVVVSWYAIELNASQRPNWLPERPVLAASRAQTATW